MSKEREPIQGRWYCADDIDRMVRELDVAMNGSAAAQQAQLCDIMGQLLQRISQPDELVDRLRAQHKVMLAALADAQTTITELRAENEALRKDGERLDWWFSPAPKHAVFVSTYMTGVEHKWAPAKWREEIDIAMREWDQKEQGQ